MHSVSPVRVRVENHVKNPMMTTNFQDFLEKNKKRVKIGSSTVIHANKARSSRMSRRSASRGRSDPIVVAKSKSLSPKPHWCPPPARTTKSTLNANARIGSQTEFNRVWRLSDYEDLIPVKETTSSPSKSCEVCKPRSPSPLPVLARQLNTSLPSTIPHSSPVRSPKGHSSLSPTRRSIPPPSRRQRASISPPARRSRSWDEYARRPHRAVDAEKRRAAVNEDFISPKREYLVEKLVETDSYAREIAKHLSYVKSHLDVIQANQAIAHSPYVINQLESDRNRLLDMIGLYAQASDDLKSAIYDWAQPKTMDFLRLQQENDFLVKQLDAVEIENNNFKKMLQELEKNVNKSGNANEALNIENNVLTNIRMCLEDNRAHLRRKLNQKESEVNRLNVHIRDITRKLDRAQIENELLRENRQKAGLADLNLETPACSSTMSVAYPPAAKKSATSRSAVPTNENRSRDIKLAKKYYNLEQILADPVKTRLYIEKLNKQLKEKEIMINMLNDSLNRKEAEEKESLARSKIQQDLQEENDNLKRLVESQEKKLKSAEIKAKLMERPEKSTSGHKVEATSRVDTGMTKDGREELDKVIRRLKSRIVDLEAMPGMLKESEDKLRETQAELMSYKNEINKYREMIDELRSQLERSKSGQLMNPNEVEQHTEQSTNSLDSKQPRLITNLTINNTESPKHSGRLVLLNEENRELLRQLAAKDELVRDLTDKLTKKTNEATSYNRQLNMALNDARSREDQLKEKLNSREKALQLRCNELEQKLSSLGFHSNVDRKDKENMAHDYLNKIRDLEVNLEQEKGKNKQMQEYVNFLKNTYMSYFGDSSSYEAATTNNLIGFGANNFY